MKQRQGPIMRGNENIAVDDPPAGLANALDRAGLRWALAGAHSPEPADADVRIALGPQACITGGAPCIHLIHREDDPRTFSRFDSGRQTAITFAPFDIPPDSLADLARRVVRNANAEGELARRRAAAKTVGLLSSAPLARGHRRLLYHGGAHYGLLALETSLAREDIALCAAITPVSTLDTLSTDGVDGLLLDARPGEERLISILRAIQRNPAARMAPRYVLGAYRRHKLDAHITQWGARGVWPVSALSHDGLPGWIACDLTAYRRAMSVQTGLRDFADATMAQSPRVNSFQSSYLALCFADNERTSVLVAPSPTRNDVPVRPNDVMDIVRRMVRATDMVFWHEHFGLMLIAQSRNEAFGATITKRLREISAGFGINLNRMVHLRITKGAPVQRALARLGELIGPRP